MFESIERAMDAGKSYDQAVIEAAAPMHDNIEVLLKRRPFMPFRMSLTDKSVHDVRDPELVRLRDTVVCLCERNPAKPGGLDERMIIALIHVVSLTCMVPDEPAVVPANLAKS
jgi:hypothetical protein